MAVLATGLGATATVGGIVFIISDMSITVTSFVYPGRLEHAELLIMSTYLVAQLLLVLGVIDAPDPPARTVSSTTSSTSSAGGGAALESAPARPALRASSSL